MKHNYIHLNTQTEWYALQNLNTDLTKFGDLDKNLFRWGTPGYTLSEGVSRLPKLQEFYPLSSYILLTKVYKAC